MQAEMIEKLLAQMSVEDLCGQLLNYNIAPSETLEVLEEKFKNTLPGGIFFGGDTPPERIAQVTALVNKYTKVPVIVSADIETVPAAVSRMPRICPFPCRGVPRTMRRSWNARVN